MTYKYEFTGYIISKGWSLKELAGRWGVSERHIYGVAKNPKPVHWDAAAGLPEKRRLKNGSM